MKRLFIISILFIQIVNAQELQSFLSVASFNSPDGPFLETYISFNANTLVLKKKNNYYTGEIDVKIHISNKNRKVFEDHYSLKSPSFDSISNNNILFIDQQRIPLKKGKYSIKVVVFDVNNKINKIHTADVDINYNNISISDIQLIDYYSISSIEDILNKSGYKLSPHPSNFYPKNTNTLTYYFETYNTNLIKQERYLINTYIESFETNTSLFNFNKKLRKKSSDIESFLLEFDITELPTGNYNLVCEIKDPENEHIATKKLFFQRSNTFASVKNENDLKIINIKGTFVANMLNKDTLKQYIDYLYPISSPQENIFAENQLRYDNLELMQKFFYNFWESRNSLDPSEGWRKYHLEVRKVNKEFRNFKIQGYLTDRGRVYLQYGPPNSRNQIDDAASTYPYEIWHYYKLKNQTNKKFVFINSDFATNEYKLQYSNVYGEVSNSEWRDKIEQDQNPTFGDDFNNNYINPR